MSGKKSGVIYCLETGHPFFSPQPTNLAEGYCYPPVRLSVRPSVRLSVRPSVRLLTFEVQ